MLAEALLRRHVEGLPIGVQSFGTMGLVDQPALPGVLALAPSLGVDVRDHRSRPLRDGVLAEADLVIGFESAHVELAISRGGAAPEHSFMILELPALLDPIPRTTQWR